MSEEGVVAMAVGLVVIVVIGLVILGMWGCPRYNVWEQGMAGKAALARADQDRQIAIAEANAKMEAASLLAGAEIERAKGVAEANRIIGESLKSNEAYLRWLWISGLVEEGQSGTIIYVPTEAGIPILEAGRTPIQIQKAP